MARAVIALLLAGCTEYRVHEPPVVEPAAPPGEEEDAFGSPPDWADCPEGYFGQYYNLPADHPLLGLPGDTGEQGLERVSPETADLWDRSRLAFQRFDATLTFGAEWWPVDDGWAGDPGAFAVRWTAWLRATSATTLVLALGASTDAWVILDEEVVAEVAASPEYAPENVEVGVQAGQYPLDVRFAHRGGSESGFRFRLVSGEALICYPDFDEE